MSKWLTIMLRKTNGNKLSTTTKGYLLAVKTMELKEFLTRWSLTRVARLFILATLSQETLNQISKSYYLTEVWQEKEPQFYRVRKTINHLKFLMMLRLKLISNYLKKKWANSKVTMTFKIILNKWVELWVFYLQLKGMILKLPNTKQNTKWSIFWWGRKKALIISKKN